jgi:16S rRNA (cytosine967-C5)-methyltransferase
MKAAPLHFVGPRSSARSLALQVLADVARPDTPFVQEILDGHLSAVETESSGGGLSAADRRLATHLVYGVLRRRGTLLALLEPLVTRRPDQVEGWLWDVLCLGAYQLAFLDHIPPHAALHETVELAASFGRPGAKGFVNGVLRSLTGLLLPGFTQGPAPDALPLEDGQYRKLARPVLPSPRTHPIDYLSRAFSLPRWLAERWAGRYGPQETGRLGFWFSGPAPLLLRINLTRTTREAFLSALAEAGFAAEPGDHPQAVRLIDHAPVRELPGYAEGWFCVQDSSAMQVGSLLQPRSGWHILDLCAAPGGKSTHLAELLGDQGRVAACDIDERRLQVVSNLARRLGLGCVETHRIDPDRPETIPAGPFDAALVDVPCSNTGVLGRRPEVRWRLRPDEFRYLVPLQKDLLRRALGRVKPGGVVVYSTCSIEPEENGAVVRAVLQEFPGWSVETEADATPGRPADGGYRARLRHTDGSEP